MALTKGKSLLQQAAHALAHIQSSKEFISLCIIHFQDLWLQQAPSGTVYCTPRLGDPSPAVQPAELFSLYTTHNYILRVLVKLQTSHLSPLQILFLSLSWECDCSPAYIIVKKRSFLSENISLSSNSISSTHVPNAAINPDLSMHNQQGLQLLKYGSYIVYFL